MTDDSGNLRPLLVAIAFFLLIFSLIGWDLLGDYSEGTGWPHMAVELFVLLIAALGTGLLVHRYLLVRADVSTLAADLSAARQDAERWRRENQTLMSGLGVAIETQFERWQLSQAESIVGLMLLKGLSLKQVADLRMTSERTVREQARALYRKAGLSGRSALSAFFLEDLLLPRNMTG